MWPVLVEHQFCPNHVNMELSIKPATNSDVTDQLECQDKCKLESECVGISYSHKINQTGWCYICLDDDLTGYDEDKELTGALNDFGFYKRPGTLMIEYFQIITCKFDTYVSTSPLQSIFLHLHNIYSHA